nr:unnamed protein product [Digitaria exilis]
MAHHATITAALLVAFLSSSFFFLLHADVAAAAATLSHGQSLGGNDTLVSPGGSFALAFFTPAGGDPSRVYLGVMYAQATEQTVPWVANRDAPVSASSPYSASVTASGDLRVLQGDSVVWSTNTSSTLGNVTLTLSDSGNLQLTAGGDQPPVVIWQSFEHPTDTFLPGMRITLDRSNGGVKRTLFTSWRSSGDPATGDFTLGQDPLGSAQLYIWRQTTGGENATYWRSGQWANTNFVGVPWRSLYVYGFKLNGDPSQSNGVIYYTFNAYNTSDYRFVLNPNGTETCYMLLTTGEWETVWSQPTTRCQEYNTCGANAACSDDVSGDGQPVCSCLKGFEPRDPAEYGAGNWTQGCVRSVPLSCVSGGGGGGDGFAEFTGMKLPNFAEWGSTVGDADACKQSCLGNCSCGGYSYSTNTGCLTWGQELVDIYEFPGGEVGYDLFVKVPSSILEKLGMVGSRDKKRLPTLLPLRESRQDFSGPKQQSDQEEAEGGKKCELPLFPLEMVAAATDDFNPARRGLLDWKTRFHIIEGIARGLLYLHRDSRLRVVHRDLKASNILLDRDMNPKISDFGMARIFGGEQNQVNTDRVVGTLGYMSPEYAMEGLFSVRSDVYSFGILVLEIVSGQKNSSFHHMEGTINIVGHAWQLWSSGEGERLVDPAVRAAGGSATEVALRCVHMALLCVQDHACDRPDIAYVAMALGSDSSVLPRPKPPTFTLQCTSSDRDGLFEGRQADESYSASDLTVTMLQGR